MSKLLSSISGGGGLPRLAPDLTYPSSLTATTGYIKVTGINAVGALTTALSLTGKFAIDLLQFENITNESMIIKLTVDGVIIWNDTFASGGSTMSLFGSRSTNGTDVSSTMQCNSSLLLEVQTTADASIDLVYVARPIL